MATLTRAHRELYRRGADEIFESFPDLLAHCQEQRGRSSDRWKMASAIRPLPGFDGRPAIEIDGQSFRFNDWSFGQVCHLAGVGKETLNRLNGSTACQVLQETLPVDGSKPFQVFIEETGIRSFHGTAYTRLYNAELLEMVRDTAIDFQPPQKAMTGGTGLYCGEQDMFAFLIDPLGWVEIGGQNFCPGFFVWNSEVGKRSVGIQTFWFQAVCQNHIVWDAMDVAEFSRKHTAKVGNVLVQVRDMINALVESRDKRRDGFAKAIKKCMEKTLVDKDDAIAILSRHDLRGKIVKDAMEIAQQSGRFTIWSIVDAITRLAGEMKWIGERTEIDQKAGRILQYALAA
jgi:hypothetical protein